MNSRRVIGAGTGLALVVAAAGFVAGCGDDKVVPDVVGQPLDLAESNVKDHGLEYTELGGGTFGIVVRSHWTVCSQQPVPGTKDPGTKVKLLVGRICADAPAERPTTASTTASPAATTPATAASPDQPVDDLSLIRGRLEGAGYSVGMGDPGGGKPLATSALEVHINASVVIYFFTTPADASAKEQQFAGLVKASPRQVRVKAVGSHLYVGTVQAPRKFPGRKFDKLVKVVEDE